VSRSRVNQAQRTDERWTVLDVGAGAQPYRPLLPSDARYRAIDTADARERFGYAVPDTEYFAGDRWPVEDGSVDVLLATETLEHNGFGEVVVHARGDEVTVACAKAMALILPLLLPQGRGAAPLRRLAGIALLVLAAIAQASLRRDGGDDCLAYNATAVTL